MSEEVARTSASGSERIYRMIISTRNDETDIGRLPVTAGVRRVPAACAEAPEPLNKWPLWKTLAFIIIYCGLAWSVIGAGIWVLVG